MICIVSRCTNEALFNSAGLVRPIFCDAHKAVGMYDIVNWQPRTSPRLNGKCSNGVIEWEERDNGAPGMLNRGVIKCQKEGCTEFPAFGSLKNREGVRCFTHRYPWMVDVSHSCCRVDGCEREPRFNEFGKAWGVRCLKHRVMGMFDVTRVKCQTPWCETLISSTERGGLCMECILRDYPEELRSLRVRIKEAFFADFIQTTYPKLDFIFDEKIGGKRNHRAPDAYLDMGSFAIVVECDEKMHSHYKSGHERKRSEELYECIGKEHMIMIRFNPDAYTNETGELIPSCFQPGAKKDGVPTLVEEEWKRRCQALKETIDHWLITRPTKLEYAFLFYNADTAQQESD